MFKEDILELNVGKQEKLLSSSTCASASSKSWHQGEFTLRMANS